MIKPGQRLIRTGNRVLSVRGGEIALSGFQHIGRSILPFEYWRDTSGRVLFATSEQRLYILDENDRTKVSYIHQKRQKETKDN